MAFEDDGDAERACGFAGRLEVIEKPTGRRSWPDAVKARIVRESFEAGGLRSARLRASTGFRRSI